eukprot:gene4210-4459_t
MSEPAQLTRLALFCDCSDADAALLSGLPQTVQDLDLGLLRTNISCSSIKHFAALRNLVKLDLSHSCMDNSALQVIARGFPRLQDLKLGYCRPGVTISVCGLGDADVAPLAVLSALEVLDLSSNVVSRTGVSHLLSAALPLCTLDLSSNRISDSGFELNNADQATSAADGTDDVTSSSPAAGHILLGQPLDAPVHAAVEPAIYSSTFSAVAASLQGLNLTHSSLRQRGIRPLVAEAAVLYTPSCGVLCEAASGWPDTVLVLVLHEPLGSITIAQQVLEAASSSSLVGAFASPPGAVVVLRHQLPLRPRWQPDSSGSIDVSSTHELHNLHAVNSHESAELDIEALLPQLLNALAEQTLPAGSTFGMHDFNCGGLSINLH